MDSSSVNVLWCMDMLHRKGRGTTKHSHEFYHYIYVREGSGHAVIDGRAFALVPHSVYVFNPSVTHEFVAEEGLRLYEFKFEVTDRELAEALSRLSPVIPADHTEVERILTTLLGETDEDDAWSCAYRRALLFELLLSLLRQNQRQSENGRDCHVMFAVLRYMRLHYGEELGNEALAAMLHMEKTYFIKQFKRHFSIPPMRYLMTLRMERAADMMANTDMSVSKVAERCGFKSIHHFSNAFKRHWGKSPLSYREKRTKE
ncbi:MAG: helix-turn-helix transcriptional regulator [Clostridia bacterium]|nr:helix-turn-helix transcriptional regulator [Clostridia bacterium]